jgi:cellulose synthase/poly-beta-1,6-N-acetylglucosamine synthase-like glycosyltransferase
LSDQCLVSVVVPVGRVDEHLPLQLDALADQDYEGAWELVLSLNTADHLERERLAAVVADRPRLVARIVDSSQLRSASHARNIGAAASRGDRLLFCDGDDVADRSWISSLAEALDSAPAVGGHLEEELLAVPGQERWRPPATPGGLPTFLGKPFVVTANMGILRAAFDDSGGFDTSLIRGEDIALSWALLDRGLELAYVPDAVVHYRHRRGLGAMMRQHFLYGRGMSQLLARREVPGEDRPPSALGALRPNGQAVAHRGLPYVLRRGSLAAGRVAGLLEARVGR